MRKGANLMNSNGFPSREAVERVRNMYPTGCRVELISMDDPYSSLTPGTRGTVRSAASSATVLRVVEMHREARYAMISAVVAGCSSSVYPANI